jgi:hypothetical protein
LTTGNNQLFLPQQIFFFFQVGRYSANFASRAGSKSLAAQRFVCAGGAKLSEFRPGGGAKSFLGRALFVWSARSLHEE